MQNFLNTGFHVFSDSIFHHLYIFSSCSLAFSLSLSSPFLLPVLFLNKGHVTLPPTFSWSSTSAPQPSHLFPSESKFKFNFSWLHWGLWDFSDQAVSIFVFAPVIAPPIWHSSKMSHYSHFIDFILAHCSFQSRLFGGRIVWIPLQGHVKPHHTDIRPDNQSQISWPTYPFCSRWFWSVWSAVAHLCPIQNQRVSAVFDDISTSFRLEHDVVSEGHDPGEDTVFKKSAVKMTESSLKPALPPVR